MDRVHLNACRTFAFYPGISRLASDLQSVSVAQTGVEKYTRNTRKEHFLGGMDVCIHFMQQWLNPHDPGKAKQRILRSWRGKIARRWWVGL